MTRPLSVINQKHGRQTNDEPQILLTLAVSKHHSYAKKFSHSLFSKYVAATFVHSLTSPHLFLLPPSSPAHTEFPALSKPAIEIVSNIFGLGLFSLGLIRSPRTGTRLQSCWRNRPSPALCAVRHPRPVRCFVQIHSLTGTARPRLALSLARTQPIAALSTSSANAATALERRSPSGQHLTASGKVRTEVPLPSQEKKEGAMQFVLFVFLGLVGPGVSADFHTGPLLTKLRTGPAKARCGR